SSTIAVSPAPVASLSFVQSPGDAMAGVASSPAVTVRAQDSFGNNVSGVAVSISLSSGSGNLIGTTTRATDVSGVATFNDLSINLAGVKNLTGSSGPLATGQSPPFSITPAAASRLTIQTQPSAIATAGAAFAQQPVVRIEDAFGNFVSTDNSTVLTATRAAGSGALQGATPLTAVNGLVSYTNLPHNVATTITIQFAGGSLTSTISSNIVVSAGP